MQKIFCGKAEIMETYESELELLSDMEFDVPATRYISIKGDGLERGILDMGFDAVMKAYKLAQENKIPYAETVELDYPANCDIKFKGENLLRFIEEYYPEEFEKWSAKINPAGNYTLSCIDFS